MQSAINIPRLEMSPAPTGLRVREIRSPIQQASLQIMTPREAVMATITDTSKSTEFVKGYSMPSTINATSGGLYSLPKSPKISIIEREALRKKGVPAPGQYKVVPDKFSNGSIPLGKDKRLSEAARIELRNKKKETSTPATTAYESGKAKDFRLKKYDAGVGTQSMKS